MAVNCSVAPIAMLGEAGVTAMVLSVLGGGGVMELTLLPHPAAASTTAGSRR
jgi:hypothetical protein